MKWLLSLLYFGIWVGLSLLVPWGLGPWLLALHFGYTAWLYLTHDLAYGRTAPIRPLTAWDVPDYRAFRERLADACDRAGLRREPVWAVLDDDECNAFAVDGRRGIVVFTKGLLKLISQEELLAVAGHELHHLKSRDALPAITGAAWLMLIGTISSYLRRAGEQMGGWIAAPCLVISLVLDIVLWTVGWLADVLLARRSRSAEHQADEAGAQVTSVATMCAALTHLEEWSNKEWVRRKHAPWSMEWLRERLHRSHPPTAERIAHLRGNREEVQAS